MSWIPIWNFWGFYLLFLQCSRFVYQTLEPVWLKLLVDDEGQQRDQKCENLDVRNELVVYFNQSTGVDDINSKKLLKKLGVGVRPTFMKSTSRCFALRWLVDFFASFSSFSSLRGEQKRKKRKKRKNEVKKTKKWAFLCLQSRSVHLFFQHLKSLVFLSLCYYYIFQFDDI